jgi:glycosyltransferase involved in cell wall biosynthesis
MKYVVPALLGRSCPLAYCVIGTYAGGSQAVHDWLWRRLMARANVVVAVGDEVLVECTSRFGVPGERATVIPNGRDPMLFHPPSARPDGGTSATIIFVGAMTAQKQPFRFVEVADHLRAEGYSLRALLVGDGPLAPRLASEAADHGVEFLGPRSDVPELLRESDILLFPSRPAGEGMPGVLIEAGLSGLPVVATPVPGASTVLVDGRTGLIVEDSTAALADAVGQLLDHPARRVAMGSAARSRCESEFTLDIMARQWRSALQPLMESQARAARLDRIGGGRTGARTGAGDSASALRRSFRRRRGSSHS